MFLLDGGNIYIHRGDSANFDIVFGEVDELGANQLSAKSIYGIDWVPENGTNIRFSVKVDVNKYRCVIQKDYVVWNGFVNIDLMPRDTSRLPFGEYEWDVRLSFPDADYTDWNTPFNPFSFYVTEVVGNNGR